MRSSEPLAQNVAAFTQAAKTLLGMTKIKAEETMKKWEEAGTMAPGVLGLLQAIIVPLLTP
jgi:hypothetical protein